MFLNGIKLNSLRSYVSNSDSSHFNHLIVPAPFIEDFGSSIYENNGPSSVQNFEMEQWGLGANFKPSPLHARVALVLLMIFHSYCCVPTGTQKIETSANTGSILFFLPPSCYDPVSKFQVAVFDSYVATQNHIIPILLNLHLFLANFWERRLDRPEGVTSAVRKLVSHQPTLLIFRCTKQLNECVTELQSSRSYFSSIIFYVKLMWFPFKTCLFADCLASSIVACSFLENCSFKQLNTPRCTSLGPQQ